jgi:putative ABC transport system permease protein
MQMSWLTKWRSLWNPRLGRQLDDELQSHVHLRAEALMADGRSREDAYEEARKLFGNLTLATERTRAVHVSARLETVLQDIQYAFRRLRRQPVFALTAIVTLGLVIGANGAIFSVLKAVLLRQLPYPKPAQLVSLMEIDHLRQETGISVPDLEDWSHAKSLRQVSAIAFQSVNLTGRDEPTRVIGQFVSATLFPMLGARPALGRVFGADEDLPGAAPVCVLSFGIWQGRFGGDPAIVGRQLRFNDQPYTVVGIMPAGFQAALFPADVWLPIYAYPNYSRDRKNTSMMAIGRLANGTSTTQARTELGAITRRLALQYPDTNRDRAALVMPLRDTFLGNLPSTLWMLAAAAGFVLLIGCANIAGLVLTQASGRRRELAVRASLGASRGRVVRQLLTESLVLSLAGGLSGILIAQGGIRLIAAFAGGQLPDPSQVRIDGAVLQFLLCVSLGTGLLFGLAPALLARREADTATRQRGAGLAQGRLGDVLVSAQVAIALVLLVGAGLMGKTIEKLVAVNPGFRTDHLLTLEYRLPRSKYPNGAQQALFHNEVASRVVSLPGIVSAGMIRALPFSGNGGSVNVSFPDRAAASPEAPFLARSNTVTPTYFETVGMAVLEGRSFTAADGDHSGPVAIVSRSFESRFWPHESAIGHQVRIEQDPMATVVGVVPDTKYNSLTDPQLPQIYVPYAQAPFIFATLVARTKGDPLGSTQAIRRAIWSLDRDQPVWKIRTMESLIDSAIGDRRYVAFLLTCFSTLALALAAIGLYGVLAYVVSQRTPEFGIRMAVGGEPKDILALIARKGAALTASGLLVGSVAALLLTRLLSNQVYGVGTADVAVYGFVCALLLVVGILASTIPAFRASRVDPVIALRHE